MSDTNDNVNTGADQSANVAENTKPADVGGAETNDMNASTLSLTQDAVDAMAKQARLGGEQSILKKLGAKDKSELDRIIKEMSEYKAKIASEKTDGEKLAEISTNYEKLNSDYAAVVAKLTDYEQKDILRGYMQGADTEELEIFSIRINKIAQTEEIEFAEAAKNYFKAHKYAPPETDNKKPPLQLGGHGNPDGGKNKGKTSNYTQMLFGKR